MTVDAPTLRSVLRSHASGVAVLTARGSDGRPVGVTLTSFTSISARPALVGFALAGTSNTWALIRDGDWFGVQLLGGRQADVARRFAAPDVDRFAPPTSWHHGPHGVPLLDGCLCWLLCSPYHRVTLGDHHLVVGAVEQVERGVPGDSLVHLYGALQPVTPVTLART